ncbi:uncharacterized protein [Diadema antillarum]|uniref:uncharacterized protein n=1 Tax=Diadema antillarum TaxID=105358 RepID=UPI003A83F6AD
MEKLTALAVLLSAVRAGATGMRGFSGGLAETCTPEQTCNGHCPGSTSSNRRPPICYCDPDCHQFRDCCKEQSQCATVPFSGEPWTSTPTGRNSTKRAPYSCMYLKNYRDLRRWLIGSAGRAEIMKHGYFLIASCPKLSTSDISANHRKLCEQAREETLLNTPVFDRDGVTYKNMFCALCNGVPLSDTTSWTVEYTNCNASFNSTEVWTEPPPGGALPRYRKLSEGLHLAAKHCHVSVTEPADAKPLRRCFPDLVSDCPSSFPDHGIRTLCGLYQSVIVTNGIYYRNKYCAQCNLGVQVRCNTVSYLPSDIRFYSLRIVADFAKGHYYVINHEGERSVGFPPCSSQDQIFDIFLEKCRVINCAKGYLTPFGDCIKIPSTIPVSCGPQKEEKNVRIEAQIVNKFGFTPSECSDMIDWWLSCVVDSGNNNILLRVSELTGTCIMDNVNRKANFSITTQNSSHPSVRASLSSLIDVFASHLESQSMPCDTKFIDFQQGCMLLQHDAIGAGKCRDVTMNSSRSVDSNGNQTMVTTNLNVNYQAKILQNLIYVTKFAVSGNQLESDQRVMACNRLALDHVPCAVDAAPYSDFMVLPMTNGKDQLKYLPTEIVIQANQYEITANGTVLVCHGVLGNVSASVSQAGIPIFSFSSAEILVSCFGLGLSLIAMLITFVTYLVFPSMRNLPGKTVMSLIVALFTGQGLFLFGVGETHNDIACTVIAIILHYSWLSAFSWTNVLAFHLSKSLGSRASSMRKPPFISKTFLLYSAYGWGAPLVVVAVSVIVDFASNADFQYGTHTSCWITGGLANLLAFGVPVGATLLVNVAMFTNIVSGFLSRRAPDSGLEGDMRRRRKNRRDTMVSFKIALLLGFTWLFAYIAAWAAITALWYVFILLNSLQGVYILTAFTCNRGTCKLWRSKVLRCRERCSKIQLKTMNNNSSGQRCIRDDMSGDICEAEEALEEGKGHDETIEGNADTPDKRLSITPL